MARTLLTTAVLTGTFCLGFTLVVDALTDALPMPVVIVLSFVSGFLGSLFANTVLRPRLKEWPQDEDLPQ